MSHPVLVPGRRILARAPVRICDVGGWTDTWFAPHPGRVCSIASGPGVAVTATLGERATTEAPVRLRAPDVGVDLTFGPDPDPALAWRRPTDGTHPLLVHAVAAALEGNTLPDDLGVHVDVSSSVPSGASLGTSSSVIVALVAAIEALLCGHPDDAGRSGVDLARRAHGIEVERAGRQAGVQDPWPAAIGGAVRLQIDRFPSVRWRRLRLAPETWHRLQSQVVTVAVGAHDSSSVHEEVIASIDGGFATSVRGVLTRLASLADEAAGALEAGDLNRWCRVLRASTDAQAALHPELVGDAHRETIEIAASLGCAGWKVNGAGGRGGSVSVVAPVGRRDDVRAALAGAHPSWQVLDLQLPSPGVTVEVA